MKLVAALVALALAGCDRYVDLSRPPDAARSRDGGIDSPPAIDALADAPHD